MLLLSVRFLRLFSYSMLSLTLVLYLTTKGFDQQNIGTLFTTILMGEILVTLLLTTVADVLGQRTTLIIGSLMRIGAAIIFAFTNQYLLLAFAGILGMILPTGSEIEPFISIEQEYLVERINNEPLAEAIHVWYAFLGYVATALGALCSGYILSTLMDEYQMLDVEAYRLIIIVYGGFCVVKTIICICLSGRVQTRRRSDVEQTLPIKTSFRKNKLVELSNDTFYRFIEKFALRRFSSRLIVIRLCSVFMLDAIGSGFVMQSMIIYWFYERFDMNMKDLGLMMMTVNLMLGLSTVIVTPLVNRIGAIKTLIMTHVPSNILLILVPFMQWKTPAVIILLLGFSISQMDVSARETLISISVNSNELEAARRITNLVRAIGLSISPMMAGHLLQNSHKTIPFALPFVIAGLLKFCYDILLYISLDSSNYKRSKRVRHTRFNQDIKNI